MRLIKYFLPVFIICLQSIKLTAQAPQQLTTAEMYLALKKLNVLGSVLYIAAHPDDENTRLLTYFSKEKLYRTGYLSLTRGDGGQNLIGDEQGVELGLIRTQELLAARRLDGAEQFFSSAYDFGYSKNPEETFKIWHKEAILGDVVWIIRKFQPDVVITRFPTTGEGGHGHHTASAILANEAFFAAADPAKYPEQLKYVQPWQVKRVLWNGFGGSGANDYRLDVGGFNALLGRSYGEIAALSRSQHKSQGFGVAATRGEVFESFATTNGTAPQQDIMEGAELTWKRVPGAAHITESINALITGFDITAPEKTVPGLIKLYQAIKALPAGYWREQKLKETQQLILQCGGLYIEGVTSQQFAIKTDSIRITVSVNNRLGIADASLQQITIDKLDTAVLKPLFKNRNIVFSAVIPVTEAKPNTQPYWLVNKMTDGRFAINDQLKIGQPDADAAYNVIVGLTIGGERFNYTIPVKYKFTDPVKGELYQPVFVVPAVTVMTSPSTILFKKGKQEVHPVYLQVNANTDLKGKLSVSLLTPDSVLTAKEKETFAVRTSKTYPFFLKNKRLDVTGQTSILGVANEDKGADTADYYLSVRAINYDHIPSIKYFYPDAVKQLHVDLKTEGHKIGYIVGAGDKVPDALLQMGYDVTLITEKEMAALDLKTFDAILTGVRAYNTNEWMSAYYNKLMQYVQNGGNLIVQYNTNSNAGPLRTTMGPYPFTLSRTRVTDENATVKFVKPEHQVLNYPNKITANDFKDWIQERSIYHGSNWDKNYETILSMGDAGETPDEGSLLIAKYGKGYFTYTGIVFFRQLPAAVPGAYRLLANIIALNKKKAF